MLTVVDCRNAQPRAKTYRLFDKHGLYLEVSTSGARYWRMKYRFGDKERRCAFGVFPEVSLRTARELADAARKLLRAGTDPVHAKREAKQTQQLQTRNTFGIVAREWLALQSNCHAASTMKKNTWLFESHALPWLDNRPIAEVNAPELLEVLRRVEALGKNDTAHRLRQLCGAVFRYAIQTARAERDPSQDLRGALAEKRVKHRAAVRTPKEVGQLLRAIAGYSGHFVVACALKLAPLVFVRPGELRAARWSEIDLDAAVWRLPAERTKMRRMHLVPLSRQAVAILRELHPLTGSRDYVFPSVRTADRPISENTLNAALRRMGFSIDEMTAHGFRSVASTQLHEQGWPSDVIERQLAHVEKDSVKASYNHAQHLPERVKMMQAWADWLDGQGQNEHPN